MRQDICWIPEFETGLEQVDAQHRQIVHLLQQAGPVLRDAGGSMTESTQRLLEELIGRVQEHFDEEERLMQSYALMPEFVHLHMQQHHDFMLEIRALSDPENGAAVDGSAIQRFLASWLTYQILGTDQSMAWQIRLIRGGASAEDAYVSARSAHNPVAHGLLQDASQELYQVLSARNRALKSLVDGQVHEIAREKGQHEAAQAEVELLRKQLLQSEKMASIGQLAAGVAHEINNPVGYVSSNLGALKSYVGHLLEILDLYAELEAYLTDAPELEQRLAETKERADFEYLCSDVLDLLRESEEGLARVRRIVSDLQDFSHVESAEWQEVDLNAGLESTLNVVWNELKYKAEVIKEYGQLPLVRCIGGQVNQVFMNLLMNAAQAIEERGSIRIVTQAEEERVVIAISDTGKGIPHEVQSRIFEPFFTTKPVGKGTGLGLSIAWDIMHKHGGGIAVRSEPGQGTTFTLTLPVKGAGEDD